MPKLNAFLRLDHINFWFTTIFLLVLTIFAHLRFFLGVTYRRVTYDREGEGELICYTTFGSLLNLAEKMLYHISLAKPVDKSCTTFPYLTKSSINNVTPLFFTKSGRNNVTPLFFTKSC